MAQRTYLDKDTWVEPTGDGSVFITQIVHTGADGDIEPITIIILPVQVQLLIKALQEAAPAHPPTA